MAPGPTPEEVQNLVRTVQIPSVQKPTLQAICAANSIGKTGNKSDLQRRIIYRINDAAASQDGEAFNQIRASIQTHTQLKGQLTNFAQPRYAPQPVAASPYTGITESLSQRPGHGPANMSREPLPFSQTFTFKSSPFYEIKARIGDLKQLEAMSSHRNSVTVNVKAQENQLLENCPTDSGMRVMVFCSGGNTAVQDIAFPPQSELKVNGGEVKANLRGLKNKPGSTRPVDITDALRLKPTSYSNIVEFTYALTQKFYFGVYVCKTSTVSTLVEVVRQGKKLSRSTVLLDMSKKASDPDVVATSQVVDLKCPISFTRPTTACRGMACSHLSCFDAEAYLQLQDQAPQWVCPVCEKSLPFGQLVVDEYMTEILGMTPSSTEQVTIDPTGRWSTPSPQGSSNSNPAVSGADLLEDEDLVVAKVKSSGQRNNVTPSRAMAGLGTPRTTTSREASTPQAAAGTKRTAEVIDLTLSDDEEPAQPCPKRPNTGHNMHWGEERRY